MIFYTTIIILQTNVPLMIFVYSGTGNSYHVARRIADAIGQKIIDMAVAHQYGRHTYDAKGEDVVFVVPIFYLGTPHTVMEFTSKLNVTNPGKVYCISTCGNSSGLIPSQLERQLAGRLHIDGIFDVQMPPNAVFFMEPLPEQISDMLLAKADIETDGIIEKIKNGETGDMSTHHDEQATEEMYAMYDRCRITEPFHVNENCIECRVCEEVCNTRAIKIYHRKPVWDEEKCDQCMACLNLCPKQAIEYGPNTKGRRRYFHKDYKNKVLGIPLRYD